MRNSNNLPGLTPAAMLTLAVALAVLLSVGVPLVVDHEPIKAPDWLGFFGTIIGSLVALGAAWVAWGGVQRQIRAQNEVANRQFALQSYGILHELAVTLENELRLSLALNAVARKATLIDDFRGSAPVDFITADLFYDKYVDAIKQLRDVRNEWDLADTKRWQFRAALNARVEFEEAIVDLQQRLETSIALLMMVKNTDRNDAEKIKERQKLLDGISFLPIFGKIAGARTAYTDAINAELGRLLPKLEDARADAKL